MLERVNEIWQAADIRFDLESTVRESLDDPALLPILQAGGTVGFAEFRDALPTSMLLTTGWDLFIVQDLTAAAGAPGIYYPAIPVAVASVVDPAGINDPGRILAHELGHSLTLPHVRCSAEGNLMSPGCPGEDRGRLTDDQIADAQAQVQRGGPAGL